MPDRYHDKRFDIPLKQEPRPVVNNIINLSVILRRIKDGERVFDGMGRYIFNNRHFNIVYPPCVYDFVGFRSRYTNLVNFAFGQMIEHHSDHNIELCSEWISVIISKCCPGGAECEIDSIIVCLAQIIGHDSAVNFILKTVLDCAVEHDIFCSLLQYEGLNKISKMFVCNYMVTNFAALKAHIWDNKKFADLIFKEYLNFTCDTGNYSHILYSRCKLYQRFFYTHFVIDLYIHNHVIDGALNDGSDFCIDFWVYRRNYWFNRIVWIDNEFAQYIGKANEGNFNDYDDLNENNELNEDIKT